MLIVPTALHGYKIEALDGRLGKVKDFLFDDRTWRCRWIVVDTGGWLLGRRVLIHPSAFESVDHAAEVFRVNLTRQQVENSPSIEEHQPITLDSQRSQFDYYSWDPFWGDNLTGIVPGGALVGAAPFIEGDGVLVGDEVPGVNEPDPNLRSISDINGYHAAAIDGDLGHVHNMLVEDTDFSIGYLILNTSDWWMGKNVLVTPSDVVSVDESERTVSLKLTREQIKQSPLWDPAAISRADMEDDQPDKTYNWPGSRSA